MTSIQSSQPAPAPIRPAPGLVALWLVALILFVVRVTGPSNLMDNDQERPASYIMDAVLHGHWWCQVDWTGDIMSKPPLFTWIGALATLPAGHANLVSLYSPCLVAMILTVTLLFRFGRDPFGWAAGFLAGLMYLAAPSGVKHIALARTDALFAATIALTALLGFRAWTTGKGWPWFWFAAALATLTKGPLGVGLGAMGLLAGLWERFSSAGNGIHSPGNQAAHQEPRITPGGRRMWVSQLGGIALFLFLTVGWFGLAYQQGGQAFIDKVIGRELVGHLVSDEHGTFGIGFVKAPLYWLSRFLPWSLLAVVGLWRVVAHPAADGNERRFERFLFCWIVGGLILFSLAKHQRGDLPLPLHPPAALLAGRELARWLPGWEPWKLLRRSLATVCAVLALYTLYLHTVFKQTWEVKESEAVASFARQIAQDSSLPPLLHVDSPYALQFHLNTMNRTVGFQEAAAALKSGDPCAVAVCDSTALAAAMGETPLHYLDAARIAPQKEPIVVVFSNLPE
jgi:4-amino-4-deoxy-L-arabinose transferase-like glycosyltransferase